MSTPLEAIRKACLDCHAGSYQDVKGCSDKECPLHPFRLGSTKKGLSRVGRIKQFCCVVCMRKQKREVRECPSTTCGLYPFRQGRNPNRVGIKVKNNIKGIEQ